MTLCAYGHQVDREGRCAPCEESKAKIDAEELHRLREHRRAWDAYREAGQAFGEREKETAEALAVLLEEVAVHELACCAGYVPQWRPVGLGVFGASEAWFGALQDEARAYDAKRSAELEAMA